MTTPMDIVWLVFLLVAGACVGSFCNVVIYRMPRGLSVVFPPSHCPSCGRGIKWYDNIPILSFIVLKGRCRQCNVEISPRYLLVEAASAALVGGLYVFFYLAPVRDGVGPFGQSWVMFASYAALLCALLVCTLVDIESFTIPLEVCWVVSIIGVVAAAIQPHRFMPLISPAIAAMALGGLAGLGLGLWMLKRGWIQRSKILAALDTARLALSASLAQRASHVRPT